MAQALARALLFASSVSVVSAHPEKLICKDPRIIEGGMMMHNYVVSNEYSEALDFHASASSYEAGDEVVLKVVASGPKYVNESAPKGVFLAIQSRSLCTLVGDHGTFVSFSDDLNATAGCASGIFSKTAGGAFSGKSTATWRAGPATKGNVTFTLLWSNGPGATDPLSAAGKVRVPDSYIFMKTIVLTGPSGPCPPPSPPAPPKPPATPAPVPPEPPMPPIPGGQDRCVARRGRCPLAGVGSPVFVQVLADEDEGEVTFPSSRCLPCRIDHRGTCRSAMVVCPQEAGAPAEERLWASSRSCEGPPSRIAYPDGEFVHCPAPERFSVEKLDLERFVPKLLRDHGHHVPDNVTARAAVEEYRRMLRLIQRFPDRAVVPSKLVDLVWHEHILDTAQYRRDCQRLFGRYVHHHPSFGGEDEKAELSTKQEDMFRLYREAFQADPPSSVWPTAVPRKSSRLGATGPLPDCCSAKCVKPSCHDCVGCNSVDCGYLAEADGAAGAKGDSEVGGDGSGVGLVARSLSRRELFPDFVSGYVPAESPPLEPADSSSGYLCGLDWNSPRGSPYSLSLDWTICGERIFFRQALYGVSAWYGIGLSGQAPYDMGFADYMVSMLTKNYSGVKDMYKYDAGNGYPCWDVLAECSVGNRTKGTKDVEGEVVKRENGVTTSSWSRKRETPDSKDWSIRPGNITVLVAHGTEDYFTYHGQHRSTCQIDFFSGNVDCKGAAVKVAPWTGQATRPTSFV